MPLRIAVLLLAALAAGAGRASLPPVEVSDTICEAIKVFEGTANTVSGDFDCQGMSIGVTQWNEGKSFSPELNPAAQVWQQLRERHLANRCYDGYEQIVDACCGVWNAFTQIPGAIRSLCSRSWAILPSASVIS